MHTLINELNISKAGFNLELENHSKTSITSINPSDGQILATIQGTNPDDYEEIMARAKTAATYWANIPAPNRASVIQRLGELLRENKQKLGELISLEMGKIRSEGEGEAQEMIDMVDYAIGLSRMLFGLTIASERRDHRLMEQWHPLGVVTIITAFNFPMAVWAWNACLAVICGNSVIWRPSPKTPLCALAVHQLCQQAMQETQQQGIFSLILEPGHTLCEKLINDKRSNLVSFTGSTEIGRKVAQQVASRLGKYLLELGGNNALIVDQDASLNIAIPAIVFGAVGTTGQRCTTTRRLLIHSSVYEQVKHSLIKAYGSLTIGDPLHNDTHMGPLIDEQSIEQYEKTIATIQKLGGNILCGGQRYQREGFFVEPTLVEAQADWPLLQQETFAPILYLLSFDSIDEAIAINNGVPQGLSSAIFTNSLTSMEIFLSARGTDCGLAGVNVGTSGAEIGGAFGGEKDTGGGRESGSDAWKNYMRRQTATVNYGQSLPLSQGVKFEIE
jgi:aldehyde dehydrogenase (NAD+)